MRSSKGWRGRKSSTTRGGSAAEVSLESATGFSGELIVSG
jgi:hypothetical protein